MSLRQKTYHPDERAALLRGAIGHWAGGAARWMLHTGCSRAEVCRLRWCDIAGLARSHPLYAELWTRRRRASEIATRTGAPLALMLVFPNYYGQEMNPTTLSDRLREMLNRGRELNGDGDGDSNGGDDDNGSTTLPTGQHARGGRRGAGGTQPPV
jgi:integrase